MGWQSCTSGCHAVLHLRSAQLPVSSKFWACTTIWFICRLLQEFPQAGLCLPVQPMALPGSGNCWEGKGREQCLCPGMPVNDFMGRQPKYPFCVSGSLCLFHSCFSLRDRIGHEKALLRALAWPVLANKEEQQCFPKLSPPLFLCISVKCKTQVFRQSFKCLNNILKMFKQFQLQLYLQLA